MLMGVIVAALRRFMLMDGGSPFFEVIGNVTSGVLIYLGWLWLTDADAAQKVRLA